MYRAACDAESSVTFAPGPPLQAVALAPFASSAVVFTSEPVCSILEVELKHTQGPTERARRRAAP